ncbi:MAG: energy-coupling factor transport system permease protein [Clostridiales bacterium]|nr:energy-coupling factor transport system permease protein [Clostridiales bacterium]
MFNDITIGQYFPGNSVIHRLDPRSKLILTLAFIIWVFVLNEIWHYIFPAIYICTVIMLSGISARYYFKGIKPLWHIIVLTLVINIFFTKGGPVLFNIGPLEVTQAGLNQAILIALRLVFLIVGASVLTLTTSPVQLTDGIERLMSPLQAINFPVGELAMMMTIALRFIPTLLEETDRIMKAQMARGADFDTGNILDKAKSMVPLLVPLFISAFRRADDLALAMEARCYRGGKGRTKFKMLKFSRLDYGAAIFTAAIIIISVV